MERVSDEKIEVAVAEIEATFDGEQLRSATRVRIQEILRALLAERRELEARLAEARREDGEWAVNTLLDAINEWPDDYEKAFGSAMETFRAQATPPASEKGSA